jgi:6-pyruvoyltetrahydropterin/6-carboxytetrahydropterin synthase
MENSIYISTKTIELGSCAFRQWRATHSHCSKIHGYQLTAKLWFACQELDDKNWCVDFGGLKELKKELQEQFDHTTCIAADDPHLDKFLDMHKAGVMNVKIMNNGVGIERAAEFVFERASKFVEEATDGRCWVDKVEVFEHADNSAVYDNTAYREVVLRGGMTDYAPMVSIYDFPDIAKHTHEFIDKQWDNVPRTGDGFPEMPSSVCETIALTPDAVAEKLVEVTVPVNRDRAAPLYANKGGSLAEILTR